jgi:hypothetical protein
MWGMNEVSNSENKLSSKEMAIIAAQQSVPVPVNCTLLAYIIKYPDIVQTAIDQLEVRINSHKKEVLITVDRHRFECIRDFLKAMQQDRLTQDNGKVQLRLGLIVWSERVAAIHGRGPYLARHIRFLTWHYLKENEVILSRRGRFAKVESIIRNEEFKRELLFEMRTRFRKRITLGMFAELAQELLATWKVYTTVKRKKASAWLARLGYFFSKFKKNVFYDGHEKPVNVDYRQRKYIPEHIRRLLRSIRYTGPDMNQKIYPTLKAGEKINVDIFQDESIFHQNDDQQCGYVQDGTDHGRMAPKKSQGQGLM